jgi:hypothetical protein
MRAYSGGALTPPHAAQTPGGVTECKKGAADWRPGASERRINRNMIRQLIQRGVQAHKPKSREPECDRLRSAAVKRVCTKCTKPLADGEAVRAEVEACRVDVEGLERELIEHVTIASLHPRCASEAAEHEAKRLKRKYSGDHVQVQIS